MQLFSCIMKKALYGDEGYYKKALIGKDGDFYTSVSTGELFGFTIASAIARSVYANNYPVSIIEIAAQKGYLIVDIVLYLLKYESKAFELLHFFIVEPLQELRIMQQEYIDSKGLGAYITILSEYQHFHLPLFIANELFDSVPCDLVYNNTLAVYDKQHIAFAPLEECPDKPRALEILDLANDFCVHKGEISQETAFLIRKILSFQKDWSFLLFDYGEDYFRNEFSLRFFKQHHVFSFEDFLNNPASFLIHADITYDVVFSYLDRFFMQEHGWRYYYHRQNRALIKMGIIDVFEKVIAHSDVLSKHYIHYSSILKTLLTPSLLGDRFKCALYGSKNIKFLRNFI